MDVYVTRHGETEFNKRDLVCGGLTDIPLAEKGRMQAEALRAKIKDIPITKIIVSPLIRARETASILSDGIIPIIVDERLVEEKFGPYEGGPLYDKEFVELRRNFAYVFSGGESLLRMAHRLYSLLDEIPVRWPNETLLLVCHGAAARMIHTYFNSMSNEEFFSFHMQNCALNHYVL